MSTEWCVNDFLYMALHNKCVINKFISIDIFGVSNQMGNINRDPFY